MNLNSSVENKLILSAVYSCTTVCQNPRFLHTRFIYVILFFMQSKQNSLIILSLALSFLFLTCMSFAQPHGKDAAQEEYQCLPCGNECDNASYNKPGKCPHCQMDLVKKSTVTFKNISPTEICDYIRLLPTAICFL